MTEKPFTSPPARLALVLVAAALLAAAAYFAMSVSQGTANPAPSASAAATVAAPVESGESLPHLAPSKLDVRPRLLTRVEPMYPQAAPPAGGRAVLRVLIGEEGNVERVIVEASEPVAKFGEAAAAAFTGAQFSSGKLNGVAVKSQLMIEMNFPPLTPPGAK
jgi:TonB family protein